MATSGSSNDTRNFHCITVASVDVIKLPLRDILASHIQPKDLFHKIKSCSTLKLLPDQLKICLFPPPGVPDYNKFDVTLLYTLIRNICSLPCPAQGWGNEPKATDTQISDDIERLRLFRNNYYAHAESASVSDDVFNDVWKKLKLTINRFQSKSGCNIDYKEELIKIERSKFTDDYLSTLRVLLEALAKLEKQTDDRDEPDICIRGENEIICGNTAEFEADVKKADSSCWSITWHRRRGDVIKCIDTSIGNYSGSTKKKLVINSISKEDEGEYQAVLSFESNGPEYKSKNIIRLYAVGEIPFLNILDVTSGSEGITIHYKCGVLEQSPEVHHIEWNKDGQQLDRKGKKYIGGGVNDNRLIITSPTKEDRGNYSCKVTNAVGPETKNVMLDVPRVELSVGSPVCFGSKTTIESVISSTPTPEKIEWQKSKNKMDFQCINKPTHFESSDNFPILKISKTTFVDKLYYRLLVWNGIGMSFSNFVFLNVTGSRPNITTSLETNIKNRFVKMIGNVFIYDDSPGISKSFWTRNDKAIDLEDSGRKLLEGNTDNPSLTIKNVSPDDYGEYQLTAINAVGLSTSDVIVLGVPSVFEEKIEEEKNGGQSITMTIESFPAPCLVQWSAKREDEDIFTPIDINADEYKGTTVTFPRPVLVVRQRDQLQKHCFRIDVTNFIGKTVQEISDCVENTIYSDDGAGFRFTKLNNNIVKQFPPNKLENLKFSIKNSNKVKNRTSVTEAKSALECIEILQDEELFTQTDVIYMQFLCQEAECLDLYAKCIEYAEKQRALCYFQKPSVNGYIESQFHVQGDLSGYTKAYVQHVIKTVAAILECNEEEILLNGVRHSTSFLLSLSVKDVYIKKLLAMNEQDHLKLRMLNIDYFIIDNDTIYLEEPKDLLLTMGSKHSPQDVLRCHLCEKLARLLYCDICDIILCKTCEEKHLSDKSKAHKGVPFTLQSCLPKCEKHSSKICERYCEQCNIPICVQCTASKEHNNHKSVHMVKKLESQKHAIKGDLRELECSIYPKYQQIASDIPDHIAKLNENSQEMSTAINKYREQLHIEINTAVDNLKSDLNEIESKHLAVLNKQEAEIKRSISQITQCISDLNELLVSDNVNLVSAYRSRNADFRNVPPKPKFDLPRFTPPMINKKQLYQQLGFLPASPIKRETEHSYTKAAPGTKLSPTDRRLSDVSWININTEYNEINSVSCLSSEALWICGNDKLMRLYNIQGDLLKQIQTKSKNYPRDIAVTRTGDVVYTDYYEKTVNIVKQTHIESVIILQGWRSRYICSTYFGDLLVVMDSNDWKQTKVVRFSDATVKQSIQYNDKGQPLYSPGPYTKHIHQNKNLDICVADWAAHAVVVVNQVGKLRYNYTGPESSPKRLFRPYGITTDSQSRILITESANICIHILDQDGLLLRYIDNFTLHCLTGICVDTSDNIFVAEKDTGNVKKIQYCK